MIHLIEDEQWKLVLEEENQKYRFKFIHKNFLEITTMFIELDKNMLLHTQRDLTKITKEIEKGKTKSKYESIELFEDLTGNFLLTLCLSEYHNFTLHFINYSADFQLNLYGHSYELVHLRDAVDLIIEEQSYYS